VPNFKRKLSTSLYWAFFVSGVRQNDSICHPDENQD